MNEASQRRLRLVTDAAYSRGSDARVDTASGAASDDVGTGAPATNSALLRLRHRWSTPPMTAVRVAFAVLALVLVAVAAIVWSRPSGAPGEEPELAWPDPPSDWTGDGDAQAGSTGEGGVVASEEGGTHPGDASEAGRAGAGDDGADASTAEGGVREDGGAGEDGLSQDIDGAGLPSGEQSVVVVHVAGQVEDPGVVQLVAGSRVHEALDAAGGPTPSAALEAINLAATLTDGQQLYVPAVGEEPREPVPGTNGSNGATDPNGSTSPTDQAAGGQEPGGQPAPVDLNAADETALQTLPGIGPAMAGRIIDHRSANGPFTSVDQLSAVSGIGPATLARLRDLVTV